MWTKQHNLHKHISYTIKQQDIWTPPEVPARRRGAAADGAAASRGPARDAHAPVREMVAETAPDPADQGGRPSHPGVAAHGRARLLASRDPRAGDRQRPAADGCAPRIPGGVLPPPP